MKRSLAIILLTGLGVIALGHLAHGVPDELPTIKVNALDASASEVPDTDTGRFRINRIGASTDTDLTVFYSVSGTATNGMDYRVLRGNVTIRAGRTSASIAVRPIDDSIVESDETVTLTLSPDANYMVGSPDSATVTIHSDE